MNQQLITLARSVAQAHGLDDALVCAIVEQESGWNPNATRYEPAFYQRYILPMNLDELESTGRSTSWGLMQVMGEVARELHFTGAFAELLNPSTGLEYGCIHFANKLKQAGGDKYGALLRWNGGGNKNYPQQVINRVSKYVVPAVVDAGDL